MFKQYYVYMLANKKNGTLYTGWTNDLVKRIYQHKEKLADGFTKRYGVDKLVYFEQTDSRDAAMNREFRIKKWYRAWKIELIERYNPEWKDLYNDLL